MREVLPALLALGLAGCVATESSVLELQTQTEELKDDIVGLKTTISSLQANQADLSVQMKRLHEGLGAYTEAVKETSADMVKLSSKLDDLGAGIASKVASIGTSLSAQQAKGLDEQKAALAKQETASSPTELFNTADVRLSLKNYALAAKGFEDYIAKFPQGALIDAALYQLGWAYHGQGKWEAAGRQFALVLEKHPKSGLTPSARLMYALSLVNMRRNIPEAVAYLESITADFPSSPEAKAAALHLKKLSARSEAAKTPKESRQ